MEVIGLELNEKQRIFCELVSSGTAYDEAAKNAGYKKAGIEKTLLQNENIREEIRKRSGGGDSIADPSEILELLTSVMRGNVHDPVIVVEQKTGANGKTQKKARVIKKSASVKERMSAAEMLARKYRIFESGEGNEDDEAEVILFGEEKITGGEEEHSESKDEEN